MTGQLEKFCDAEDDRGGVERKRSTVEDQDDERKDEDLTDVCISHGRRENHGREPWQDGSEPELVFKSAWQWRSWWVKAGRQLQIVHSQRLDGLLHERMSDQCKLMAWAETVKKRSRLHAKAIEKTKYQRQGKRSGERSRKTKCKRTEKQPAESGWSGQRRS